MKDGLEHLSAPLREVVEGAVRERAVALIREHLLAAVDLAAAAKAQHPLAEVLCSALEEIATGAPREMFLSRLREDAEHWAYCALPLELEAYVGAGLQRIERTDFAAPARKRLLVALWGSMNAEERRRFLSRVDPEGQFVRRGK
jgi:hypothetical protein